MGNYVQSLRASGSQGEARQSSADSYDWSLPTDNPFRESRAEQTCNCTCKPTAVKVDSATTTPSTPSSDSSRSESAASTASWPASPAAVSPSTAQSAGVNQQDGRVFRKALTSTVNVGGQKPANLHESSDAKSGRKSPSKIPLATKRLAAPTQTMPAAAKVNTMQSHTVDVSQYSNAENQAKIEPAINAHTPAGK